MRTVNKTTVVITFATAALISVAAISFWFGNFAFANNAILVAMFVVAPIASAMIAIPSWQLLLKHRQTYLRAISAGVLIGIASHPIAWYLLILSYWIAGARDSLGASMMNPLEAVAGAIIFALWSILIAGWITVLCGGVTGLLLLKFLSSNTEKL